MQADPDTLQFACFTLDCRHRVLLAEGRPVALHARAFDVLAYLVAHRDTAVSRADILEHVWENRTVSDNNLSVQLASLRKALTRAGCREQLILTMPNQRYRFVGEVRARAGPAGGEPRVVSADESPGVMSPDASARAAQPRETSRAIAGEGASCTAPPGPNQAVLPEFPTRVRRIAPALVVAACLVFGAALTGALLNKPAAPAPRLSLVVLPFRQSGTEDGRGELADAITDDLTADLAHLPASAVIARESAQAAAHETTQQIGRNLGVRYILGGAVMGEDGRTHITTMLTEAATARTLWSAKFDVTRDGVSSVREKIARAIASQLHVQLNMLEATRALHDRPDNPDALDLFFEARSRLDWDLSAAGFDAAQHLLQRAVSQQPGFVDAQAELARALIQKVKTTDDPDDVADFNLAKQMTKAAVAASPQNTVALASEALELELDARCDEAQAIAKRVLEQDQSSLDARMVLAGCALDSLRFDVAVTQLRAVLQLDPIDPRNRLRYTTLGIVALFEGRLDEAIDCLKQGRSAEPAPSADFGADEEAWLMLIAAYQLNGEADRTHGEFTRYGRQFAGRTTWRIGNYMAPSWRTLPAYQRIIGALHSAGMPRYADEGSSALPDDAACGAGDFAPTPLHLKGGKVVGNAGLAAYLSMEVRPLVVDLGRAGAPEPDWVSYNSTQTSESPIEFAMRVVSEHAKAARNAPVLVLGDGVSGCTAYNAASKLVTAGFSNVSWFRGGEEAWAAYHKSNPAGRPEDR